jgi:hypothetical protein
MRKVVASFYLILIVRMLNIDLLIIVMLSVNMLNVIAPSMPHLHLRLRLRPSQV